LTFSLRQYQKEALEASIEAEEQGILRQLIVIPTGGGKTEIFSRYPDYRPNSTPMLIIAHREELLEQARQKIKRANPNLTVSIEQGKNVADHTDVVLASVATLGRANSKRLARFPRDYFKLVVVDEAHHAAAPTYRRILDYFADALLVGVTATPRRGDNVGLHDVFDSIVYTKTMEELINDGFLSPLVGYRFNTDCDLSDIKIVRGDFAEGELANKVNTPARNEAVVEAYLRFGPRKALAFCVDVAHAQAIAQHFQSNRVEAHAIWGAMDHDLRRETMAAHDAGEFPVLTNCQIATEGYDSPSIDMILMARPTKSTVFYAQAVGRGLRLHPGKQDCLVVDIADVSRIGRPIGLPSLVGLPADFDLEGKSATETVGEFRRLADTSPGLAQTVKSFADINGAWEKIDLFTPPPPNPALLQYSQLVWVELGDEQYVLNLQAGNTLSIQPDVLDAWHVTHKDADGKHLLTTTPEMGDAFRFADAWIKENHQDLLTFMRADARWRDNPVTEKQGNVLRRAGIPYEHLTRGQASQIIDKLYSEKKRPAWLQNKIRAQQQNKRF
jgi:ATP-dependent helicase IRC3